MAKKIKARTLPAQNQRGTVVVAGDAGTATKPAAASDCTPQDRISALANCRLNEDIHSLIAKRAYEIWMSEGGSELDNWLKAEREISAQSIAAP